jgi:hypothetical protein
MFNNGYEYMKQLTGLFLGAGASYEAGLPLVWELTDELKKWLTPAKLREFNQGWRLQGGRPRSAEIIGRKLCQFAVDEPKGRGPKPFVAAKSRAPAKAEWKSHRAATRSTSANVRQIIIRGNL